MDNIIIFLDSNFNKVVAQEFNNAKENYISKRNHVIYYKFLNSWCDGVDLYLVIHNNESYLQVEVRRILDSEISDLQFARYGDCDSIYDWGDGFKTLDELNVTIDMAEKHNYKDICMQNK